MVLIAPYSSMIMLHPFVPRYTRTSARDSLTVTRYMLRTECHVRHDRNVIPDYA